MKKSVFNYYATKVAHLFDIKEDELFSRSRRTDISDARSLLYYLCYIRPMSVAYIQKYMHGSGSKVAHTSILYGINKVKQRMREDSDYINIIENSSQWEIYS